MNLRLQHLLRRCRRCYYSFTNKEFIYRSSPWPRVPRIYNPRKTVSTPHQCSIQCNTRGESLVRYSPLEIGFCKRKKDPPPKKSPIKHLLLQSNRIMLWTAGVPLDFWWWLHASPVVEMLTLSLREQTSGHLPTEPVKHNPQQNSGSHINRKIVWISGDNRNCQQVHICWCTSDSRNQGNSSNDIHAAPRNLNNLFNLAFTSLETIACKSFLPFGEKKKAMQFLSDLWFIMFAMMLVIYAPNYKNFTVF